MDEWEKWFEVRKGGEQESLSLISDSWVTQVLGGISTVRLTNQEEKIYKGKYYRLMSQAQHPLVGQAWDVLLAKIINITLYLKDMFIRFMEYSRCHWHPQDCNFSRHPKNNFQNLIPSQYNKINRVPKLWLSVMFHKLCSSICSSRCIKLLDDVQDMNTSNKQSSVNSSSTPLQLLDFNNLSKGHNRDDLLNCCYPEGNQR